MHHLHLLYLSLLVLGRVLDVSSGNNVVDCCLRTSENLIPRRIVQDYWIQLVQDGCVIPATVFITTRGKRLCAPLQAPWVIRLREKLDASSTRKNLVSHSSAHPLEVQEIEMPRETVQGCPG